ncbi:MAG: response regulator [Spirochaetales bacterium]|nr:response regulator [Spirochaetales bacterium]
MDKKIQVLIADDEELACRAIATMLNRHFPDLEIVAQAANGREAVEEYIRYKPELVFMDIKMPGLNGSEAASLILKDHPDANIIMLTAYDSFGYAQEAINAGARAYLLKPINSNSLVQVVQKIQRKIQPAAAGLFSGDFNRFLDRELVQAFCSHEVDWDKIDVLSSIAGKTLSGGFSILLTGDFPFSDAMEFLQEALSRQSYIFAPVYGFISVLVFTPEEAHLPGEELRIANRLYNTLQNNFPGNYRIAVGCRGKQREGIRVSYEQSLRILMAYSQKGVYDQLPEQMDSHDDSADTELTELCSSILENLETGRISSCRSELEKLIQYIRNIPGDFNLMLELVNSILVFLKRYAVKRKLVPGTDSFSILSDLSRIPGQRELARFLEESVVLLLGEEDPLSGNETKTVMEAFLFLQEHIFDDISLEQIADYAGVSSQYLSRKIKEKFGMNFLEYLTGKRLEYAQYLLLSTNESVKDIARKSGYGDANYFSRLFKKNLGQTPLQFRQIAKET